MRSSGKQCLVECQGIYVDVSNSLVPMIEPKYENYKDTIPVGKLYHRVTKNSLLKLQTISKDWVYAFAWIKLIFLVNLINHNNPLL